MKDARGGSMEDHPPILALPLQWGSGNPACHDQEMPITCGMQVLCIGVTRSMSFGTFEGG